MGCDSGAAILEFALVLPIIVALLAGTVEIGRALFTYVTIERALRGGARYLARVPDPTCNPACSWGAAHAIDLTRGQIVDSTGLAPAAIMIAPQDAPPYGTVVMTAEVKMTFQFLVLIGISNAWTLTLSHQEQRIEG